MHRWLHAALATTLATALAPAAHATVVTVAQDLATLNVSASGCAELRDDATMQPTGVVTCGSSVDSAAGRAFVDRLAADALGGTASDGWAASAFVERLGGAAQVAVQIALQSHALTGLNARCGAATCRVLSSSAVAAVDWSAQFGLAGGGATLRLLDDPPGLSAFTMLLYDLTLGVALDPAPRAWSLLDGHDYSLSYAQTQVGGVCVRRCGTLVELVFDGVTEVRAADGARRVPEPASAALLGAAFAAFAAFRRRPRR